MLSAATLYSCKKLDIKREIAVTTDTINVSITNVAAKATIIDLGEKGITDHGHVWDTAGTPTISGNKTSLGMATQVGSFTSEIIGLFSGTWYIRAYVTDGIDVRYGEEKNFVVEESGTVCDTLFTDSRDGKTYKAITIGTQCWMAENLNYGTKIQSTDTQKNNSIPEKYCYENMELQCNDAGGLYQWDEAMQYGLSGAQGICPAGWHIPSDSEWKTLEKYLGMSQASADSTQWRGPDLLSQLVSGGSSGFNLDPAGYRKPDGSFFGNPGYTYFWTSSESDPEAWVRGFTDSLVTAYRNTVNKKYGFCIRCIKD